MARFILSNTNRFYLPGQDRFLHLAEVKYGLRTYLCMFDTLTSQTYIEELRGNTTLDRIEDDQLAEDLATFLTEMKVLDMYKPAFPDNIWHPSLGKKKFF